MTRLVILRTAVLVLVVGCLGLEALLVVGDMRLFVGQGRISNPALASEKGVRRLLVCQYFDGWQRTSETFAFSRDGLIGRDTCPLLLKRQRN
jgi:hypothetical protein